MRYLNEESIRKIGFDWDIIINAIESTVQLIKENDYNQPIKPYLRFKNLKNRIIAMPAYVGGNTDIAGIKWIASFPDNIRHNKPRAHSVIILNDADSGKPVSIINTALISAIRTASVTGFVIREYLAHRNQPGSRLKVGIIGFGPIGQIHLQMLSAYFNHHIEQYYLFDINGIDNDQLKGSSLAGNVHIVQSWQEVYNNCELLITCTVSEGRYINMQPRKGALYCNVSLRDFELAFMREIDMIVVDDWDEICRENTDIECAHKAYALCRENVQLITNLVGDTSPFKDLENISVMFNPMGMAVFDLTVAKLYYDMSVKKNIGATLE